MTEVEDVESEVNWLIPQHQQSRPSAYSQYRLRNNVLPQLAICALLCALIHTVSVQEQPTYPRNRRDMQKACIEKQPAVFLWGFGCRPNAFCLGLKGLKIPGKTKLHWKSSMLA